MKISPVHGVTPNSARAVLRCQGLLPATRDCNNTSLTPFETVVYDPDNDGRYVAGDLIIVGPTPANGALLKNDPKIMYRDTDSNNHWDPTEPVFYNTNNTLNGRVFLYGSPTISATLIKTDQLIKFTDTDGNGVLDGVVAITARLENLGGTLPGGTQQDVPTIQIIFNFDPTLLQVMCTSTPCATSGSVLSGQFDAWCVTNAQFCNPGAGKYTYLVDNYCSLAAGSTFDKVSPDNSLGKISTNSACLAAGAYDYGLGCDPATRNVTLSGTCPGDITNGGVGALSNLDVLRVEFMVVGTGSTSINHVKPAAGVSGTQLLDVDGLTSTPVPVAMFNTTFSNGSNVPPTARFTYSPTNIIVGQSVSFNGTSSSDPDGTITNYQWNFGDGATASGLTASHSFTNPGNYTVSLTVTDNGGATNTASQTIQVTSNFLPVALFTITPGQPLINQPVTFNATQSHDPNQLTLTYRWNLGDGSTANTTVATHAYTQQGAYVVILTVTNTRSLSSSTSKSILVTRVPYLPGIKVGDWATFLASGNSSTTQGLVLATINVTRVSGTNVTFTSTLFYINGTTIHQSDSTVNVLVFNGLLIPASLAAGDVLGSPFGFSSVTINNTIAGIFVGAPRQANTLILTHGTPLLGSVSAEWDQASGILLSLNTTSRTGSGQAGAEQLLLVDTNIWPATQNKLPIPVFTWKPLYGIVGQSVSFDATHSYDPDAGDHIASYHWDFGDGTSATAATSMIAHTYSAKGTFNVTLTVTDTVGGSFSSIRSLTVLLPPPLSVIVLANPALGRAPLSIVFTASTSGGSTPYAFSWSAPGGSPSAGSGLSLNVTYSLGGTYTVSVTVSDNAGLFASTSISVTLSPALASLKILVTDSNGSPLQGATVKLYSGSSQNLIGQDITGTDGSASFGYLLPGGYSYQISFGNYQTDRKTVSVAEGVSQSNTVSLPLVQPAANRPFNYLLYAGIGVALIIIIAIAVLFVRRRKPLTSC